MKAPNGIDEIKTFCNIVEWNSSGVVFNPSNWSTNNIILHELPLQMKVSGGGSTSFIHIHKNANLALHNVFEMIRADYPEVIPELIFSGSFVPRTKRGQSDISVHATGLAIDFNAEMFPFDHQVKQETDVILWFQNVIHCFRSCGWKWGGDFGDPMHFQFCTGY